MVGTNVPPTPAIYSHNPELTQPEVTLRSDTQKHTHLLPQTIHFSPKCKLSSSKMASKGQGEKGGEVGVKVTGKSVSSTSSESSSTEEEERLRRLFQTCDRDGDGFIDSQDLAVICCQLGMEDAVEEIMLQLGADENGRISFEEFVRCRMQLINEIEQEHERCLVPPSLLPPLPPPPSHGGGAIPPLPPPRRPERTILGPGPLGLCIGRERRVVETEVASLFKLMEEHDEEALQRMIEISDTLQGQQGGSNFMEVANSLHLAALTSLRGDIIDATNRLQQVTSERDHLEKQVSKVTNEKARLQRDAEDRIQEQGQRYEERMTELHSVIAELRKKLDRHQINVIREEDEYEESEGQSNKSNDEGSCNDNVIDSQAPSLADIGNDLNAELSRVVSELEDAIGETRKLTAECTDEGEQGAEEQDQEEEQEQEGGEPTPGETMEHPDKDESTIKGSILDDKTQEVCKDMENIRLAMECTPSYMPDVSVYEVAISKLQEENSLLQDTISGKEVQLNQLRTQLVTVREERDRLKRRTRELQTRLQCLDARESPHDSRTSTPTKLPTMVNPTTGERTMSGSSAEQAPVAKMAGLKKLKTGSQTDRQVLGAEISSIGLPNAKVAEHLVQNLQESSDVQEISATLTTGGNEMPEAKLRELEIEFERLTSKIDNLKSQNDLMSLTLEESKAQCDHLSVLMGKYESNNTALQMAVSYSDQALEAYGVLVNLVETEQGVLLANCRAAGVGSINNGEGGLCDDQEEIHAILQRAHQTRKSAEHGAKQLLQRLDRSCGVHVVGCGASPWEELSSNSRTASTTSSTASSADTEFSKVDEAKLREYISQLKNDRSAVKMTVLELESVHIDPLAKEPGTNMDAQRLDLENAVLMQELMAMKEEKAELKAQNYLLETEKSSLELQLSGKTSQEQAYMVQIEHLKEQLKESQPLNPAWTKKDEQTPSITLAELRSHSSGEIAMELQEAMKREKKLKARIQELMVTLEKVSKNSDIRHQQSAEFVSDLKRANSALVSAFEKAKKKYQDKVKKLEARMRSITERYETQLKILKQKIAMFEEESSRQPASETSL